MRRKGCVLHLLHGCGGWAVYCTFFTDAEAEQCIAPPSRMLRLSSVLHFLHGCGGWAVYCTSFTDAEAEQCIALPSRMRRLSSVLHLLHGCGGWAVYCTSFMDAEAEQCIALPSWMRRLSSVLHLLHGCGGWAVYCTSFTDAEAEQCIAPPSCGGWAVYCTSFTDAEAEQCIAPPSRMRRLSSVLHLLHGCGGWAVYCTSFTDAEAEQCIAPPSWMRRLSSVLHLLHGCGGWAVYCTSFTDAEAEQCIAPPSRMRRLSSVLHLLHGCGGWAAWENRHVGEVRSSSACSALFGCSFPPNCWTTTDAATKGVPDEGERFPRIHGASRKKNQHARERNSSRRPPLGLSGVYCTTTPWRLSSPSKAGSNSRVWWRKTRLRGIWKAAFNACIGQQAISSEMKLLQLRPYVSGEALACISGLGYSAAAYKASQNRLERSFGGSRRYLAPWRAVYTLRDWSAFRPSRRVGAVKEFERFTDLLDVAVLKRREAGRDAELGNGVLYTNMLKKLTTTLLAQYQRWVVEM